MDAIRGESREMVSITQIVNSNAETFNTETDFVKKSREESDAPPLKFQRHGYLRGALNTVADGVKDFVQYPFNVEAEKQAEDTLAGLEPFFWMLRLFGLCPIVEIFSPVKSQLPARKRWNTGLSIFCGIVGVFLFLGFITTFGFSMVWPIAFCAGFNSIMNVNVTYCQKDIMQRFLTPKGMHTLIQSSFLLIGTLNMVTSIIACLRLRSMIRILREYFVITPAKKYHSHSKMAYIHIALTIITALAIGVPFTVVYEMMLNQMKSEQSYEGYPFADIDSPLIKIENWIAYTKYNSTISKSDKFILNGLKITFRVENIVVFISCFAVPAFFSLMCDVLGKAWSTFVAHLQLDITAKSLTTATLCNLRQSHWMLCKMSAFLDECFSFMILVIFILFIVVNSCIIYTVLKFGMVASGQDRFAFFQAILMFIALEIIFFLVIRQAMRVHRITQQVGEEVRNWQPKMDGVIDGEYLLLVNQTTTADTTFTAWSCFRIEQAAYLNAIAVIFSYVLLLLQYQPPNCS